MPSSDPRDDPRGDPRGGSRGDPRGGGGYRSSDYDLPHQQQYGAPQHGYEASRHPHEQCGAPYQQHGAPQHYRAPQQQYGAPQQQYGAPQQHYGTPQQHYGAPQQHYRGEETRGFGGDCGSEYVGARDPRDEDRRRYGREGERGRFDAVVDPRAADVDPRAAGGDPRAAGVDLRAAGYGGGGSARRSQSDYGYRRDREAGDYDATYSTSGGRGMKPSPRGGRDERGSGSRNYGDEDDVLASRRLSPGNVPPAMPMARSELADERARTGERRIYHEERFNGPRVGMKRPEPPGREVEDNDEGRPYSRGRRPKEEKIDLWCESCRRGLQDKNSMAAHLASKKHKQMVEEYREMKRKERMGEDDSDSDGEGEPGSFYQQKSSVTQEETEKFQKNQMEQMSKAPEAFKKWANRSLSAAKAKGENMEGAVFQEIREEFIVAKRKGDLKIQNWGIRDCASGRQFKKGNPADAKIPLFAIPQYEGAPKFPSRGDRVGGSTVGLGAAAGHGRKKSKTARAASSLVTWFKPGRAATEGNAGSASVPSVASKATETVEGDMEDPLIARHGRNIGQEAVRGLCSDKDAHTGDHKAQSRDKTVVGSVADKDMIIFAADCPGYRPSPGEVDPRDVPILRRNSSFRPRGSKRVRTIFSACVECRTPEQLARIATLYDRDFGMSGGAKPSGARRADNEDPQAFAAAPELRESLRCLAERHETKNELSNEFVEEILAIIYPLENGSSRYTGTLMGAYELLLQVLLASRRFSDAVWPSRVLMLLYQAMEGKMALRKRDEHTANFVMLLMVKESPFSSKLAAKALSFRSHRKSLSTALTADLALYLPRKLYNNRLSNHDMSHTSYALRILSSGLCNEWSLFFSLYRNESVNSSVKLLMEALMDALRSHAVNAVYVSTDAPALFPVGDLVVRLGWSTAKEAIRFIRNMGVKVVEPKVEDDVVPPSQDVVEAAQATMTCAPQIPVKRRELVLDHGIVKSELFNFARTDLIPVVEDVELMQ